MFVLLATQQLISMRIVDVTFSAIQFLATIQVHLQQLVLNYAIVTNLLFIYNFECFYLLIQLSTCKEEEKTKKIEFSFFFSLNSTFSNNNCM